jgi:hypothetical protein
VPTWRSAVALRGSLKDRADNRGESLRNLAWPEEVFGQAGQIPIRLDSR